MKIARKSDPEREISGTGPGREQERKMGRPTKKRGAPLLAPVTPEEQKAGTGSPDQISRAREGGRAF